MNAAVGLVGRSELRRRWVGLAAVMLLAVLVSAAVLAGVNGARRTASTLDRFRSWSNAADAQFQTDDPSQIEPLVEMLRADPAVEAVATRYLVNAFPTDGSLPDFAVTTDPDGRLGTSIDRRRVLEGRMPDADAPDEVLLNELAARLTGLGPGDRIEVKTFSPIDIDNINGPDGFPGFNGPTITLTVVGIGRAPEELPEEVRRDGPAGLVGPGFLAAHPDVGPWPPSAEFRARDLDRALPAPQRGGGPHPPGRAEDRTRERGRRPPPRPTSTGMRPSARSTVRPWVC